MYGIFIKNRKRIICYADTEIEAWSIFNKWEMYLNFKDTAVFESRKIN